MVFAKRYLGLAALCVKGSYWCSRFKLALERAGVQSSYPRREQSHQWLCQRYHSFRSLQLRNLLSVLFFCMRGFALRVGAGISPRATLLLSTGSVGVSHS